MTHKPASQRFLFLRWHSTVAQSSLKPDTWLWMWPCYLLATEPCASKAYCGSVSSAAGKGNSSSWCPRVGVRRKWVDISKMLTTGPGLRNAVWLLHKFYCVQAHSLFKMCSESCPHHLQVPTLSDPCQYEELAHRIIEPKKSPDLLCGNPIKPVVSF